MWSIDLKRNDQAELGYRNQLPILWAVQHLLESTYLLFAQRCCNHFIGRSIYMHPLYLGIVGGRSRLQQQEGFPIRYPDAWACQRRLVMLGWYQRCRVWTSPVNAGQMLISLNRRDFPIQWQNSSTPRLSLEEGHRARTHEKSLNSAPNVRIKTAEEM